MRGRIFSGFVLLMMFLFLSFHFSFGQETEIRRMALIIADHISKSGKMVAAVVDFVDLQGNVTELGRFLAEELSVALVGVAESFEVVDRTHLMTLLKEHKLSESGVIDPATAKKLGQAAGADVLITGTITSLGNSVRLSVKVLDIATQRMITAHSIDIPKTKVIEELLSKGIATPTVPTAPTTIPAPTSPKGFVQVVKNFTFEVKKVVASGDNVTIQLMVTNNDKDQRISFGYSNNTFIIDNFGNKYNRKKVKIGNRETNEDLFVSGVPINVEFSFDISPDASSIAVLQIECYSGGWFTVQFRNISLSR